MTEPGVPAPAEAGAGPDEDDERVEPRPAAAAVDAEPARSARFASWSMAAVVAGVVALDHLTKWWAQRELSDGRSVEVMGSLLKLTLTYNSGMAFSRGTGLGPVIGVVAVVVIVVLLASLRRESSRLARFALASVIGGAIGNLLDRAFRSGDGFLGGSVVDFLQLPRWPVFNVADMAVTLGGITLVLGAWRAGRHAGARAPAAHES
jgi:signal peptidase II